MPAGLLTAGGGHAWETAVVAALSRPGAPLTVVRRCADIADVLATASTGQAAGCLLAADLRRLDTETVARLGSFGVAVVVVHTAGDHWAPVRLGRIGVTALVSDDAGTEAVIAAVGEAMAAARAADGSPTARRGAADPLWALSAPGGSGADVTSPSEPDGGGPDAQGPDGPAGSAADQARVRRPGTRADDAGTHRGGVAADPPVTDTLGGADGPDGGPGPGLGRAGPGTVVAVWGPGGAPGRSTVAMGIADRAAAAGRSVLLIDADVYGGVLATAFGLLDESAGLAGACRLAANGRLAAEDLTRLCWRVGDRLTVLTGIARADRWPEIRPSALPAVLRLARQLAELVVVDCAAVLETDEEISFDTMAPRRNGATLAVLDDADIVLAVGAADPPGMERLIRGLAELAAAVDDPSPSVVLNRVRRTAASPGELVAALRRFGATEPIALLPEDRAACDRAWQRGVTLTVAAPKSPLTGGLTELAGLLRTAAPAGPVSP